MFSLVFSFQWRSVCSIQCRLSVCTVHGVYCSVGHSPSVLFSVCSVQSTGCNQESVMFMSCSESALWISSAPAQFLNFNILSTTGHLRTKYIKIFKNPLINAQWHSGTYLFSVSTHQGSLLVSSRFSKGDFNFRVYIIPLWQPCVEITVMLRASMHRPVGGAL